MLLYGNKSVNTITPDSYRDNSSFLTLNLLIVLLFSCNNAKPAPEVTPFFDLKHYFQEQAKQKQGITLEKTVKIDTQEETQTIPAPNLEEEFSIFANSDINKIAWQDKYTIDSTFNDGQLSQINYTTTDKKLKTKKLHIEFQDQTIKSIQINNQTENAVYKTTETLNYHPQKGYTIYTQQNIKYSSPQTFEIKVKFQ